jgi:hypothetical protein
MWRGFPKPFWIDINAADAELRADILERDQGSEGERGAAGTIDSPRWPPENTEEMAKKLEHELLAKTLSSAVNRKGRREAAVPSAI